MTEKLGVLLVDVPEPRLFKYYPLVLDRHYTGDAFFLDGYDKKIVVEIVAYKCTQEEAKKIPAIQMGSVGGIMMNVVS